MIRDLTIRALTASILLGVGVCNAAPGVRPGGALPPSAALQSETAFQVSLSLSAHGEGFIWIIPATAQTLAIKSMGGALPAVALYDESGALVARARRAGAELRITAPCAGRYKMVMRASGRYGSAVEVATLGPSRQLKGDAAKPPLPQADENPSAPKPKS